MIGTTHWRKPCQQRSGSGTCGSRCAPHWVGGSHATETEPATRIGHLNLGAHSAKRPRAPCADAARSRGHGGSWKLSGRQRADQPLHKANNVQDEQDPALSDHNEDAPEDCNDPYDDDQKYDDIEMVHLDVVEEVDRAGLDDTQTQMK